MDQNILKKEVNKYYPNLCISKIYALKNSGIMNNIFVAKNKNNKYIIKIYKNNNLKKIKSEHTILDLINKKFPESLFYIKNIDEKSYTFSKKIKKIFGIYYYKKGITPKISDLYSIEELGLLLSQFHKISSKISTRKNYILFREPKEEFGKNLADLRKALFLLSNKPKLNEKEETIKKVLYRKLKLVSQYDIKDNIKLISKSSKGIIHGDFVFPNVIFFKKKIISVLDWENACNYIYIWEIFRSMCYNSKIGNKGIICSKLDRNKAKKFIEFYKKGKSISNRDFRALKLMFKYYYFLDSYIISSYILDGNKRLGKLISNNVSDHFWFENHYEELIKFI